MEWLYILLGIVGGCLLLMIIFSLIVFHLAVNRYSSWNTDKNEVIFSFSEPFKSQAYEDYEWYKNNGEWVDIKSNDNLTLKAKLFIHPNAKRNVIMIHGYRGKPEFDFSLSHRWYYNQESNVLIIYQRSHGPSEGKYITFGIYERDDIHLWEEYMERLNTLPIYLIGISMGGAGLMMSFYKPYSSRVKAIVVDSAYYSIHAQFVDEIGKFVSKPVARFFLIFANWWCRLFAHFSMKQVDTRKIMKDINIPVLFAHGDSDKFVKDYQSKRNYEACDSSHKYYVQGHGAGHGYTFLTDEQEYKEKVIELMNL